MFMTDREIFYRHLGLPSFNPLGLEIVNAEGVWLWDPAGKEYMDLVAGITVSNIGHRHPDVIAAIVDQTERYLHLNVYGELIQAPQVKLAQQLAGLMPGNIDAVYFVNSGSEAIEGALKLAKRYTGRTGILSFTNSYHGSTHGSLSILGHEGLKNAFRPLLPDTGLMEYNDDSTLDMITDRTACVVMEMVQAEAGIIPVQKEFLIKLRDQCSRYGVLIIVDDVQMGMGRTGKLFSTEHYDFVPDILVLAKALGAGMPLGAFAAPGKMMRTLAFNPELGHITTFGGHPVSCAAALAGLNVLLAEGVIADVEAKGTLLQSLLEDHPALSAIRRRGLAFGLDLKFQDRRMVFQEAAIENGVVIDWYLFRPACFRIAPPLTITTDEIYEASRRVRKALDAVC